MQANIFRFELHRLWRSVVAWSAGVTAVLLLYMSLFPSFAQQAQLLEETLRHMPPALLKAFAVTEVDLSTVLGYYSFLFVIVQLILAVQAAGYGFGLLALEESQMTADFLLTRPVTRSQVLSGKLLAAMTALLVTTVITWVDTWLLLALFRAGRSYNGHTLWLLLLSLPLLQGVFLGLGVLFSLIAGRIRNTMPYALALGFGAYVLNTLGDLAGVTVLERLTPFRHVYPTYIVRHDAYNVPLVLLSLGYMVVALAASYHLYSRRDIPTLA